MSVSVTNRKIQRQDGMGQVCVRNKGGNGLLAAPVVVDATGDAEVIRELDTGSPGLC